MLWVLFLFSVINLVLTHNYTHISWKVKVSLLARVFSNQSSAKSKQTVVASFTYYLQKHEQNSTSDILLYPIVRFLLTCSLHAVCIAYLIYANAPCMNLLIRLDYCFQKLSKLIKLKTCNKRVHLYLSFSVSTVLISFFILFYL